MNLRRVFEKLGLTLRLDEGEIPLEQDAPHRAFEDVFPQDVRSAIAELGTVLPDHLRKAPMPPRGRRSRISRWTIAAAVMLIATTFAATYAAATGFIRRKPVLVSSDLGSRGERVAQFGMRSHVDFEAAGVPPEATIKAWSHFIDGANGVGTVYCIELPGRQSIELCGFGARGEYRWSARRSWSDWSETIGREFVRLANMTCLVTRYEDRAVEETVCLVFARGIGCLILLVDPESGAIRGRCFYPGLVGQGPREVISLVPDLSSQQRRLLFVGRLGDGPGAEPSALILESDGTPVEHLLFPKVGIKEPGSVVMDHTHTDWAQDRLEVTLTSSEGLFFSFIVQDRELVRDSLLVSFGDTANDGFDDRHEKGAWKRMVDQAGSEDAYGQQVAGQVRRASLDMQEAWR